MTRLDARSGAAILLISVLSVAGCDEQTSSPVGPAPERAEPTAAPAASNEANQPDSPTEAADDSTAAAPSAAASGTAPASEAGRPAAGSSEKAAPAATAD
ncbi:MAG: hypothetical protein JRI23_18025, partial [Deltaproteobacteria bacterium]|nr:hypothetical protein [Deltaproteobacteria bacterium]MBW2533744.1 hypothetical protein [Deltaproteobacteria bacterium]